ncbi:hypothetical protein NSA47_01300 [Irregularibacter muris]|uniref:Uncharacterized protein n=1 Tax=Irregularibacter muris TaxID=1796619 RepID=A0AAE3HD16_9FIRM|nr:hypothetical protein [Irregularibacter muris]MCR1897626.1 hypothetical protein [Irregularibacter muris]
MKKNNLYIGLLYMALGAVCLGLALNTVNSLGSLLFGFSGGGLINGLYLIWRYFYWTSPKRKAVYEARLEEEQINLKDEFKESLRNRSGRIAYIITFLVIALSIVIFSIMGSLGILDTKMLVLYLFILWIFMYIIGIIIYRILMKKYQ